MLKDEERIAEVNGVLQKKNNSRDCGADGLSLLSV